MRSFLQSKIGLLSAVGFVVLMAFALQRVATSRRARAAQGKPPVMAAAQAPVAASQPTPSPQTEPVADSTGLVAQNAAYLDAVTALDGRARQDRDRQGNPVTRRDNPVTPTEAGQETQVDAPTQEAPEKPTRASHRLRGRRSSDRAADSAAVSSTPTEGEPTQALRQKEAKEPAAAPPPRPRPKRFNPYGSVLKCELVFTLDSTNEQTPLVAIVMEPVYNNGLLVIPAGAELHGVARPDRLRDRIFSGPEWVMVFPRERGRPNGRQLTVRGVALDRIEPDSNGMTWGLTDGSYGLEGTVIRSLKDAEIKRFVATFLAAGSLGLQERNSDRSGQQLTRNTPANAALLGLAANFDRIVDEITTEIAEHGVFIRVPAGHQFYFYPMQIIDPDAADISTDIATVK